MAEEKTPELRIIKTARKEKKINKAAKNGFWPLIKKVIKSPKIKTKYCVTQDKKTGEIRVHEDYRDFIEFGDSELANEKVIIDWTYYYPYHFKSPFAAYLVPKDIKVGEHVILEDLIEDFVGSKWNQGDTFRLHSCEAIWNGTDFEILLDKAEKFELVG